METDNEIESYTADELQSLREEYEWIKEELAKPIGDSAVHHELTKDLARISGILANYPG